MGAGERGKGVRPNVICSREGKVVQSRVKRRQTHKEC